MSQPTVLTEWFAKIDADVCFLIDCFAEVLGELGQPELAALLPWGARAGVASADPASASPDLDRELQALSIAYHLLNLVEENAAAQARRARENTFGLLHEPGLWGHGLKKLIDDGLDAESIAAALDRVRVEVVLTAHPTEAKRPAVLRQHRELFDEFCQLENEIWTEHERTRIRDRIKVILERLWRTGEMYLEKPDVLTELDYVADYLFEVFPNANSRLQERFKQAWEEAGLDTAHFPGTAHRAHLTFGNWVGGDRDGHPLVTADVTRATLAKLRAGAVRTLDRLLEVLTQRLTLSVQFQPVPQTLLDAVASMRAGMPESVVNTLRPFPREPWRAYVELIRARCTQLPEDHPLAYAQTEDLIADLMLLRESLIAVDATRIARAEVDPVVTHLQTFGFHLAALDIRQNSDYYARATAQLLRAGGFDDWDYTTWDVEKRLEFLNRELDSPRPIAPRGGSLDEEAQAVVDCFQVIADEIADHGISAIGSFIVSMTRDITDLLVVYLFAREVGLLRDGDDGMHAAISVVPLFETVDDLERGPEILRAFLEHPIVRASMQRSHNGAPRQQVMIGYSDSNKDAGIFASHWNLHRAQRELARTGEECGVAVEFFHGRGGTFSRGAGPTHRFLEALPPGSLNGGIRMTEQGEVIAQKFGNIDTAVFNLELLVAGVASTAFRKRRSKTSEAKIAEICDRLSDFSSESYRELIAGEGFLEFWSQATPIDALERSFIGSRPSRRTGGRTLDDLRAIPWVFSWTQSRFYLPSWYGVGAALSRLEAEHRDDFAFIVDNIRSLPFVSYVLNNVETALASADADLMEDYASLVENESVRTEQFQRIEDEYTRTQSMIQRIFSVESGERRPRLVKTLDMRAKGLRRLHGLQIELLKQWRPLVAAGRDEEADAMIPSLLLSINAIASAERSTG